MPDVFSYTTEWKHYWLGLIFGFLTYHFSRCQADLFPPLMVYQGKICTAQFMKLFSTSLPYKKTIQSKYESCLVALCGSSALSLSVPQNLLEGSEKNISKRNGSFCIYQNEQNTPYLKIILSTRQMHKYLWVHALEPID